MTYSYRTYYAGKPQLADPYGLLRIVFTTEYLNAESDGLTVTGVFATPQTPAPNLPVTIVVEQQNAEGGWDRIS